MKARLLVLVILFAIVLAGCSQGDARAPATAIPVAVDAVPTATAAAVVPPAAAPAETAVDASATASFNPIFAETACPFAIPEGTAAGKVICGFVTVPEDHRQPDGPTIRIAIAVVKEQSSERRPDPVIVLSGGPGQKTLVDTVAIAQVLEPFHPNRDLIIFDQRGVGFSEPSLNCPEFVDALFDNLDQTDPTLVSQTSFNALLACRERLVAEGHNLAAFTTWQNGADVEAIRVALGYEEVNLYGGSYGSHLAQVVMRDHPDAVRSVIIDSVYPVEISLFVDVATTSSAAILHLLDACAADEACSAAYPDLKEAFFTVVDRLNDEPVPITITNPVDGQSYEAYLTGDVVVQNLRIFLYDTMAIPLLPQAIYDVYNGDYDLMTRLTGAKLARFDRLSTGMEISVLCTDDLIGRTSQDLIDNLAALPPQLAGSSSPDDIHNYGIFAICEEWPVTVADPWVKEPIASDIPTLVLSGEFDPVTPPEYAELAASHLSHSYVFVFRGVGHNPVGSSSCARNMVADFLTAPTASPDASCMTERTVSFVVPTDYDTTELASVYVEEHGVSSRVPQGWTQVEPGVFASPDYTQVLYIISIGTDLETFIADNEMTGPIDEIEVNGRTWTFYEFQPSNPEAIGVDAITVGEDGTLYDVAIIAPADQRAEIKASVQMPAIEAFAIDESAVTEDNAASLTLIAYSSESFGVSGVVPQGWPEAGPGIFQRGQVAADPTTLIQKSYPDMSVDALNVLLLPQLGLSELPAATGVVEANGFTWDLYLVEIPVPDDRTIVVAFAQDEVDGVAYMVLLQAVADDYEGEAFFDTVFMPALEALQRLAD